MSGRTDTERILDAYLAPEADRLPDRVIDAALANIARTPQRRALRVPWRFPTMPAISRATGIAAMALVAVVGVGGLIYVNSGYLAGASVGPSPAPTAGPSEVAPGITGWTTYTSEEHRLTLGYPAEWSVLRPATRQWQAGDGFPAEDAWPYADSFVSPGEADASIGLLVWDMQVGPGGDGGADLDSVQGLKAWAETFCNAVGAPSCATFTQRAVPMCLSHGGESCRAAILVPTAHVQYAFFRDWETLEFVNWDEVNVVVIARADSFPPAARYGGSVELLKSILTTMDVWTPGQEPPS